jgi:glyoxylase-like metal-dependent hydrolase (beta-lactamase superfamily II)
MKVFFHYCIPGFANCYILGEDDNAIIIDPGGMDADMISLIEGHHYKIRAVLLTHDHKVHIHGLSTMLKIYKAPIYAATPQPGGFPATSVRDGDKFSIGPFDFEALLIPGHSSDSTVWKIGKMLFTGDVMTAGLIGSTLSSYGEIMQMNGIQSKLFSLPGDYMVLPGHGPPTSLETERKFNAGITRHYNAVRRQHENR